MGAVVVVDQHLAGDFRGAGENVPARRREIRAVEQKIEIGNAAGRDDHDIGAFAQNVVGFGVNVGSASPRRAPRIARARQSTTPRISRRRARPAATRTCPPGASAASSKIVLCPRAAATRAASSPPGPPPTTTKVSAARRCASRHAASSVRGRSRRCARRPPGRNRCCRCNSPCRRRALFRARGLG